MLRYYKLFDMLNRRGMNKSSLLEILSSKTIAKLSKGENINSDVIEKICKFLNCQPGDIMEYLTEGTDTHTGKNVEIAKHILDDESIAEPDNDYNVYINDDNSDLEEGNKKRLL